MTEIEKEWRDREKEATKIEIYMYDPPQLPITSALERQIATDKTSKHGAFIVHQV